MAKATKKKPARKHQPRAALVQPDREIDPLVGLKVKILPSRRSIHSERLGVIESRVEDTGPARLNLFPGDPGYRIRITPQPDNGPAVIMFLRSEFEIIPIETFPPVVEDQDDMGW